MPNWCNNTITIQGQTETIKTLWDDAVKGEGLLQAMVPQPEDIFQGNLGEKERKMCLEQGIPNWYDWNINNWGTKWDVSLEGLEFEDNGDGTATITGWFESAWAPPIDAYNTFCENMDGVFLEAYYDEPGMVFCGRWTSEAGDEYYEYGDLNAETIADVIPEDIVEFFALDERLAEWEEEMIDA
jgi:hypothetical protein